MTNTEIEAKFAKIVLKKTWSQSDKQFLENTETETWAFNTLSKTYDLADEDTAIRHYTESAVNFLISRDLNHADLISLTNARKLYILCQYVNPTDNVIESVSSLSQNLGDTNDEEEKEQWEIDIKHRANELKKFFKLSPGRRLRKLAHIID